MRILFVTMQYGRSYLQGTERYIATLTRCLRDRGHEVHILAGDPLGVDRQQPAGEPVEGTAGLRALPGRGWMTVQGNASARLLSTLREIRPDVVHLANPAHVGVGITKWARRLGIPVIVTTMDFWWVCPKATLLRADGTICPACPGWRKCIRCIGRSRPEKSTRVLGRLPRALSDLTLLPFLARAAGRGMTPADLLRWRRRGPFLSKILTQAAAVIFPSQATWNAIRPQVGHDRCRILPYGLSAEWFADPRPRPAGPRRPEELTIGFAGALLPHKGPHLLLQAVRRLGWMQTRLRLAGPRGGDEAYARLLREAQGLKVEFTGPLAADRMPAFLRGLDLLAMTSVWPENLPFIVLEAQAAGVPVVASRLAGVADQVGETRLLFEPGSAKELAGVLQFAVQHLHELPAARVVTADEMTERTLEVYQAACNS